MKTKVLQFGEGNFLRCFVDWMVQKMNDKAGFDGAVQIIQPIGDELSVPSKILNGRGGKYHTCLRGVIGGNTVEEIEKIECVKGVDLWTNAEKYATEADLRFVFSNTTEAGIQYVAGENTFPAKVAKFLKARLAAFSIFRHASCVLCRFIFKGNFFESSKRALIPSIFLVFKSNIPRYWKQNSLSLSNVFRSQSFESSNSPLWAFWTPAHAHRKESTASPYRFDIKSSTPKLNDA